MKLKIVFLIIGVVVGSGITYLLTTKENLNTLTVYSNFQSFGKLDTKTSISCTFPQIVSTYYRDGLIEHGLAEPETNPMVFTFSDFNIQSEGMASLSYVDASQSISTVPLVILHEDKDKIVLIENGGLSYLTAHTIFKKQGVAIFSKQILLPVLGGVPSGTMAMGTCR